METMDREKRERLILSALLERRVEAEEETKKLQVQLTELTRRETELREEIATLEAILGALPKPAKESEPPSLFAKTPAPPRPAAPPKPKRRRKGSRREQLLPILRERFGSGAFTTEDVTNVVLDQEPGERRKAYYASWSLCRDLEEDGVITVIAQEGSGKRTKKTFTFAPK